MAKREWMSFERTFAAAAFEMIISKHEVALKEWMPIKLKKGERI